MRVAKVNGTDTRQNMIMVIAKFALKMKIFKNWEEKKIFIDTNCLTVRVHVIKKICNFKILITVWLDIVKDVLIA